jgi:hypothetical protein
MIIERHFCASAPGPGGAPHRAPLLMLDIRRRTGERRAQRCPTGGRPRDRRFWKAGFQWDFKRPSEACPQETSSARMSPTSPRATLGALGDPIECFLTRTGGSNGRWDVRKVQMPEDPRDHRLVGDGGHDPERTASAKRAGSYIQSKHAPQQPRPAPARRSSVGLIPTYTLLARRWHDCPAQRAVRSQTARVAHKMNSRQGYNRYQLL